jgi:transposase
MASDQRKAVDEQRTVVWIDESAFALLAAVVRTYAPRGQTPILDAPLSWDHLSAIGALTLDGRWYMGVQERPFRSTDIVCFLKRLLRYIPGKLLVLRDQLPAHRGQPIQEFLANAGARIHLGLLPAYAPELDSTEGMWQHLKYVEMKNLCCHDLPELRHVLRKAKERLSHKPDVLRSRVKLPGYVQPSASGSIIQAKNRFATIESEQIKIPYKCRECSRK